MLLIKPSNQTDEGGAERPRHDTATTPSRKADPDVDEAAVVALEMIRVAAGVFGS